MPKTSALPAIRLRGVRHNNLKGFDLDLPLNRLIVITGLSGSGKSSLAFDTLFAEGQRRYIETFSPYARQFFDRMDKPRVDSIEGIPPAIAIEQRNTVKSTRSTVGTMTEVCDHMKLLWPKMAVLHCRQCGRPVRKETPRQVWKTVTKTRGEAGVAGLDKRQEERELVLREALDWPSGPEVLITFDLPLSDKLGLEESLALIARQGYQRLLWEGEPLRVDEAGARLAGSAPTHLRIIQDRLRPAPEQRARFIEACEQAYHFGKDSLTVHAVEGTPFRITDSRRFSNRFHCASCDLDYREPTPALFSFNHPLGACPACRGFGRLIHIDYDLAIPDRGRTLAGGAVKPWQTGLSRECQTDLMKFCRKRGVPTDVPFQDLPVKWQEWVIQGDADYGKDAAHEWPKAWYGVRGYFRSLESKSYKMHVRVLLSRYRAYRECPDCGGRRFQPDALLFRVAAPRGSGRKPVARGGLGVIENPGAGERGREGGLTLADFYRMPIRDAMSFVEALAAGLTRESRDVMSTVLNEVVSRLRYLDGVGLGYLTLDRATRTLSGGETERVNLTTCLGTRLVNTLFVLDEPSVGLHPRDTDRLIRVLHELRDAGNTVVVVEHEASVMRAADQIVDLGPGHGETGGELVFQGTQDRLLRHPDSLTGHYLSGRRRIAPPPARPVDGAHTGGWLVLEHARRYNLLDLSVRIPLGRLVCVSGVSGSGKTTLVREVLLPALDQRLRREPAAGVEKNGETEENNDGEEEAGGGTFTGARLTGWEALGRAVLVDQSPIGRTPRSNPAVYVGAFEAIRELFARLEPAKQRGLNASAFSFNSQTGQCEKCRGAGFEKIEMQFLSDVFIRCPECKGRRYRPHVLEILIEGELPEGRTGSRRARSRASKAGAIGRRRRVQWSIADLLEATVEEAVIFLLSLGASKAADRAVTALRLLEEVGLGYLRLGQPINTLSGGESQRLKLAGHLAEFSQRQRREPKPTLFLFDEPTTGLHFEDVRTLLSVFQRLVDAGHTVMVIEHHLDVIGSADWVIDLGPGAGDEGGRLVCEGPVASVVACDQSHTGRAMRTVNNR